MMLGVCIGGKVEGLARDAISIKKKKKLFHKPHCCVTVKWAVRGKRSFPRFNRKHKKD